MILVPFFCFWTPSPALATTVWRQVGGDGLGDPTNTLVAAMTEWNSYLYLGVGRDDVSGRIYRSSNGTTWDLVKDGFGHDHLDTPVDFEVFDGALYVDVGDEDHLDTPAEIWRTSDGQTWEQAGTDGLGDNQNFEFFQFETFNDQLYVGSINAAGGQLFRTSDGDTWDQITNDGFGDNENGAIWGLKSYGGYLWAGTINYTGAQIWRSTTGDVGDWTKFYDYETEGAPEFTVVNILEDFKGHLYWGAGSVVGLLITERLSDTEFDYSLVGLGDANNIRLSEDTQKLGSYIYFGTLNNNPAGGAELWYSGDGLTATQLGEDGFGDHNNFALYAFSFQKYLYIGFSNGDTGIEIWRRLSTSDFGFETKELPDGTQYQTYSASVKAVSGKGASTYEVTDGSLPPGLSLDEATGAITGTPTEAGEFTFEITATDANGNTTDKTYTLKIIAGAAISVTELPQSGAGL